MRILAAVDLEAKSMHAVKKAAALAAAPDAVLRIVYVPPAAASDEERATARDRLHAFVTEQCGVEVGGEHGASLRVPYDKPEEAILWEARQFGADLIVLGGHGVPRFRDALFGTTAGHIARHANQSVLVVQNDPAKPYAKVMAAVENETAEEVLRLACEIAPAGELFVVHAFGTVPKALFDLGDQLEKVTVDQQAAIDRILASLSKPSDSSTSVRAHNIVREGDAVEVLMHAWFDLRPDLVVMGTRGRAGLALLFQQSVSQTVLLGCPSDVLVVRAGTI